MNFSFLDILLIVLFSVELILALIISSRNIKRPVNFTLALFTVSIVGWGGSILAITKTASEFAGFLAFAFGSVVILTLLLFAYVFPNKEKLEPASALYLIPTVFFALASFVPGMLFQGIVIEDGAIQTTPGLLFYPFALYALIYMILSGYFMVKRYRAASGISRLQFKYFLIGMVIFVVSAMITNVFLPVFGILDFNNLGPAFSIFFVGFTGYSIARYRLMDIRVVLRRSAVYVSSLVTVILLGSLFTYVGLSVFGDVLSGWMRGIVIMIFSLIIFDPVRKFYLLVANKYFFTSLEDYQKTLESVTHELTTIIDSKKVISLITDTLEDAMGVEDIMVYLVGEKDDFVAKYSKGFEDDGVDEFVNRKYLLSALKKEGGPLVRGEIIRRTPEAATESATKRLEQLSRGMKDVGVSVCVPLFRKKKLTGVIVMGSKVTDDPYTVADLDLIRAMSSQAAIALENAELYREVQDYSQNLQEKVEQQTKKIKELYEMKSNFLTVASHQLRTPTSIIRGTLSMLVEGDIPEEKVPEMIDAAFKSSNNLERVIDDILTAAEIESARFDFDPEPVEIIPVVSRIVDDLQLKAEKRKLHLEFVHPGFKKAEVMTHPTKIEQAFVNLVDNALNYTEKGSVMVSLEKVERRGVKYIAFVCKDSGVGMTEKDIANIGKKFFRSKNVFSMRPNGTGLGMYIVQSIVDSSKAKLLIESEGLGKGSTFTLLLREAN